MAEDALHTSEAGPKAIRGGVLRFGGYGAGVLLGPSRRFSCSAISEWLSSASM